MLSDEVIIDTNNNVQLKGYIRGNSGLNCDQLIHITDIGDFQIDKIIKINNNSNDIIENNIKYDNIIETYSSSNIESLYNFNVPEPFNNEQ